jgi:hypothetical protein
MRWLLNLCCFGFGLIGGRILGQALADHPVEWWLFPVLGGCIVGVVVCWRKVCV